MKAKHMNQLKIGPLPRQESARLSITVSKPVMEALELYAADFNAFFSCDTDVVSLVPQMLEAFIRSDKAFMKRHAASIREQAARAPSPLPSSIHRESGAP
jgi:hypothetical protein